MNKHGIIRLGFLKWAGVCALVFGFAGAPCLAQTARVARQSVAITPDATQKKLAVAFRLVDDMGVVAAQTAVDGGTSTLPTTWEALDGDKAPACAWMIVIDTSNPARRKTVEKGVEFVQAFVKGLPGQDKVAVYSLARDLQEVVPFDKTSEELAAGLATVKPAGDASLTTLIFSNLRQGLVKLEERREPRKAILLLTDGKDETTVGADNNKDKLVAAAKSSGVVLHTIGYAEAASEQVYFGALKEIAAETDGIFVASSLDKKEVSAESSKLIAGVMHGAGTAHINVATLADPAALTLTVKTAAGRTASITVPKEKVAEALTPPAPPPTPTPTGGAPEPGNPTVPDTTTPPSPATDTPSPLSPVADSEPPKANQTWLWVGGGVLLAIVLAAILMVNASRRRAAEDARMAEEARLAEEERMADDTRRGNEPRAPEPAKPESPPLAWLEMCDAQQTRHAVRVPSLKIGRGQHNDFVLRNDSVSGNHCVLNSNREGQWTVTDLNSGNGVVLNGVPVKQSALKHGDAIELGDIKMRFLLPT